MQQLATTADEELSKGEGGLPRGAQTAFPCAGLVCLQGTTSCNGLAAVGPDGIGELSGRKGPHEAHAVGEWNVC